MREPGKSLQDLVGDLRFGEPLYVTRPALPPLEKFIDRLQTVWATRQLTNHGSMVQELEKKVARFLEAQYCSMVCNGTMGLLVLLRALNIRGEVITTPFTFPATLHALTWCGITPVFCDIDPKTLNIDAAQIEESITSRTSAILGVHVYGNPCDIEGIARLGQHHKLSVIYDAAHAFGAKWRGRPLPSYGDASIVSFHATKLFSTAEGGAVISDDMAVKRAVDELSNFGIQDEETVARAGINGKLSELQAAFGLALWDQVSSEISRREQISETYREGLAGVDGVTLVDPAPDLESNHAYFTVMIDGPSYGMSRDELYRTLRRFNVYTRRYFYPLVSRQQPYREIPSAQPEHLPVAEKYSESVLCLPMYGDLEIDAARRICEIIARVREC